VELDSDQRLGGADRYSTSSLVAEEIDDLVTGGASTVIVANGEDFPDALSAAPLTEAGDAPVLLVQADSIPRSVADRMNRLTSSVDDVIVVGGTAAISAEVYAEIEDIFDDADVVRVAGDNRYATAAAVADEVGYGDAVAIVSGQNWADAVTIGGWASDNAIPILLANADGVPTETSEALTTALDEGVTRAIIVGGSAAVGSSVRVTSLIWDLLRRISPASPDRIVIRPTCSSISSSSEILLQSTSRTSTTNSTAST